MSAHPQAAHIALDQRAVSAGCKPARCIAPTLLSDLKTFLCKNYNLDNYKN